MPSTELGLLRTHACRFPEVEGSEPARRCVWCACILSCLGGSLNAQEWVASFAAPSSVARPFSVSLVSHVQVLGLWWCVCCKHCRSSQLFSVLDKPQFKQIVSVQITLSAWPGVFILDSSRATSRVFMFDPYRALLLIPIVPRAVLSPWICTVQLVWISILLLLVSFWCAHARGPDIESRLPTT